MKQRIRPGEAVRRPHAGLTTVEMIMLVCLLAVACYAAWHAFGDQMRSLLTTKDTQTQSAPHVFD